MKILSLDQGFYYRLGGYLSAALIAATGLWGPAIFQKAIPLTTFLAIFTSVTLFYLVMYLGVLEVGVNIAKNIFLNPSHPSYQKWSEAEWFNQIVADLDYEIRQLNKKRYPLWLVPVMIQYRQFAGIGELVKAKALMKLPF